MIMFLLLVLVSPCYSINADEDTLKGIYTSQMDENDFKQFDFVYIKVYSDLNYSEIKNMMGEDFKKGDSDNDGILSFDEFSYAFKLNYGYYLDILNPYNETSDYDFFMDVDSNNDNVIDFNEFSQHSYIFAEDSFWEGYSIEEMCDSEFARADNNGNEYLNYREFKLVI